MTKRFFAVFLAAVLLASLLSGCFGATDKDNGASDGTDSSRAAANEIAVGIAQDLDNSLDPYQMTAAGT